MVFNPRQDLVHEDEQNKVLYFPYINVPKNDWFVQTLLYWDEVGAIVPNDYNEGHIKLDRYMEDLVSAKLVIPIRPDLYNMQSHNNFYHSFVHLIEYYGINRRAREARFGPLYTSRIHIDKFGYEIARYLVDEKLAIAEERPWYRVESLTASLFMTYLATVLGNDDRYNMKPITDDVSTLLTFNERYPAIGFNREYELDQMRIDIFEDILPVPQYIYDVKSLADFKEKYGKLLPKFRRKIESKIKELSFVRNSQQSNYLIREFRDSTKAEIEELVARMKESNWEHITFGTMCGLGAAAIPGIQGFVERNWMKALEALPGVIGAVYAAYDGNRAKQRSIIDSPLAYAAFTKVYNF